MTFTLLTYRISTGQFLIICGMLLFGLSAVNGQAHDWADYTIAPQDQRLQGPCLGFANSLLISTQLRIEHGIPTNCSGSENLPRVSPWSLHFYGIIPGEQRVSIATRDDFFEGRYEDGYLLQFSDCFADPGFLDAECWRALDYSGPDNKWRYENIEKCASINCPEPDVGTNPNHEYVLVNDYATTGAKVDDFIDVSTANRTTITDGLKNGPFVLRLANKEDLHLLSADRYNTEGVNYHAVLVIGIEHLPNNNFRLMIADSWPGNPDTYTTDILSNTSLSGPDFDAWRISGVAYLEEVNGRLVEINYTCEETDRECDLEITELGPTGAQLLTRNHPNHFRARVTEPGAPINDWTVTVTGGSLFGPQGTNTAINFDVIPTNNFVVVEVSVACPDGQEVVRVEAFEVSRGGGGWGWLQNDDTVVRNDVSILLNANVSTTFTDEGSKLGKAYDLQLFSVAGQKLWQHKATAGSSLSPSLQLIPGIYFLRMEAQNGSFVETKKVLIGVK